ncbi:MAG: hypothetical protein FJX46_08680 [Alphaproteobacteria bacterium]|nr:hypothetical protein [Alphaproteobacteria bacterium]
MSELPQVDKSIDKVKIDISVVLGKAIMPVHQLLKMGRGAVIELEARVDDHAWIYANGTLIARGEVVLVGDTVAVSITEVIKGVQF